MKAFHYKLEDRALDAEGDTVMLKLPRRLAEANNVEETRALEQFLDSDMGRAFKPAYYDQEVLSIRGDFLLLRPQ